MARRKTKDLKAVKDGVVRRRKRDADGDYDEADDTTTPGEVKWWTGDNGTDAQAKLWTWIDRLRAQWSIDGIGDLVHEAIYADEPIARGGTFDGQRWHAGMSGTCVLNAIKSLVDTATAKLTKVRSMPCITADDAPYSQKRFARKVSRVLRRKMGGEDMEEASPLTIRDFCIRGTGVLKTEIDEGDTVTRRIPIYELVWDHREAQFCQWPQLPSTMAHVRPETRERLLMRYPDYRKEIADAPVFRRMDPWMQFVYQGPSLCDLVEVAESWHPPQCDDDENGQHIVCIRGTTILREPWLVPRYPLALPHWTAPVRGVRGKGLVAEHTAAQEMINGILHDAREGIREGSQLKVFASRGANVNKHHLRAKGPAVVEVDGAPGQIQYIAADPVSKQAWAIAFQIKDEMYNLSGISQWAASSKSPVGTNASGKALDTMNDNQSDRFAHVETIWQQARVAVGRAHVDLARHLANPPEHRFDEQPEPVAKKDLAEWIRENDWKRVDLDSGDYHLTLEPVNFITGTRGGKLEEIAEAAKAGLIPDPTMTAALVDEPDIQRMNRPILGPLHRIEACLEGLADLDTPYIDIAPDMYMNLSLAELMAKGELEEAKADGAPDEICQRFCDFLADIDDLKKASAPSPSLPGGMPNTQIAQPNAGTLQPAGMPPIGAPGGMRGAPGPGPQGVLS